MHDQPKVVESRIRQELAEFEKFYNRLVKLPRRCVRARARTTRHRLQGSDRLWTCSGRRSSVDDLAGIVFRKGAEHMEVKAQGKDAAVAIHATFNVACRRLRDS